MKKIKQMLKRVKLRTLIVLIILLMFNAYAWFVYTTKVKGDVTAHIEGWDVTFQSGEEEKLSNVEFDVGRIYPGMDSEIKEIKANNLGEKEAKVTYTIQEATILGVTYLPEDIDTDYGDDDGTCTNAEWEAFFETFPFHITISVSNAGLMEPGIGTSTIEMSVIWPFEQEDDTLDTYWGQLAYEYYKEQAEIALQEEDIPPSISITIELRATQVE